MRRDVIYSAREGVWRDLQDPERRHRKPFPDSPATMKEFRRSSAVSLGCCAEPHSEYDSAVSRSIEFNGRIQSAVFRDFAIKAIAERVFHRSGVWRFNETTVGVRSRKHRLLVTQLIENQPKRCHFSGGIKPYEVFIDARGGNDMVELSGRRHIRIQLALGMNEHRVALNAGG